MRLLLLLLCLPGLGAAQAIKLSKENTEAIGVYMSVEKGIVKAVKDSSVQKADEPTFVKIKGSDFKNGTIEVSVLSKLLPNAPDYARGFIGVAFRVSNDNTKFECIYIRPTNGRADDQVRRNHSIQYYSYPDYKFDRLRKEAPERYESYADMGLNEWIRMRIEVQGTKALLFLNDSRQPALVVSDLKLGELRGGIALWVETGTEGYFRDLKVQRK